MYQTDLSLTRNRILTRASNIAFCALTWVALGVGQARATDCDALNGKKFGGGLVTAATAVAPPFSVSGMDPPVAVSIAKPFCRLQGRLEPSADSNIHFEVWLPPAEAWNGKYAGIGNGGFAGSLTYAPMTPARPRDGRASHRTVWFHRHHAGSSPCLWALRGDHLLEAAHVRSDRRKWCRPFWPSCSNATRSNGSVNGRPRDGARCFRIGPSPRA